MPNSGIKVFAPATVANLAVGFDILGLALEAPGDEIIATPTEKPGVHIDKIIGDNGKLPKDPLKNTVTYSALQLLVHLKKEKEFGVSFQIHKKMPFGSGLGSSAASAVAGVVACNEILGRPLSRRELLPFAVAGEQLADGSYHADNVAPSLLGGITLIRNTVNHSLDAVRLPVPKGLFVSVVYPHITILTKDARNVLSETISLQNHSKQSSLLGCFIAALYTSDFDLLRDSLQDIIIEPQRSSLIPHFDEIKSTSLEIGALGCSISGAGPTIFALSANSIIADSVTQNIASIFNSNGIKTDSYTSVINMNGAIVY